MAEVGQRLVPGVCRLIALRNSRGRPVCTGDRPGCLPVTCTSTGRPAKAQPGSETRATHREPEKLSREGRSKHHLHQGSLLLAASLELDSSCPVGSDETKEKKVEAAQTALILQEKLLPVRMTSWTRAAVSSHPDPFRSHQQLRDLCTVIFTLTEQEKLRLLGRRHHPFTAARDYSWRSDRSRKDAPLHRSRTAYYDILRVTPGATQSQIKTAYYQQSFIYHPDKNPGNQDATRRFSEISEAYTVLGNISLRRKYDRGILRQSDVQSAGRPSSKEATSRSTGSPQQQQQHHHHHHHQQQQQQQQHYHHQERARGFSQTRGKTMFDFDAFYQAHYGEQLQREKDMRARRQHMKEVQKEKLSKWADEKKLEVTVLLLLSVAGLIFLNMCSP